VARRRVGLDQRAVTARRAPLHALLGARYVRLLAVEHVGLVTLVPERRGLDRGEVGAATGLGRVDTGERFAFGDLGQQLLLELVRAVLVDDVRPADREQCVDGRRHREVSAGDLVNGDHRVDELLAGHRAAAELLGDRHAEHAELGHARGDVAGDAVFFLLDLAGAWFEVLGEPFADRLPVEVLLSRVPEIHPAPSSERSQFPERKRPPGTPTCALGVIAGTKAAVDVPTFELCVQQKHDIRRGRAIQVSSGRTSGDWSTASKTLVTALSSAA